MSETTTPKTGECYCGCGTSTDRHFAAGHDLVAASMLHFLLFGTTNMAETLVSEEYGPGAKNLRDEAMAKGWQPRE
jgi:hypothetical protein